MAPFSGNNTIIHIRAKPKKSLSSASVTSVQCIQLFRSLPLQPQHQTLLYEKQPAHTLIREFRTPAQSNVIR